MYLKSDENLDSVDMISLGGGQTLFILLIGEEYESFLFTGIMLL